MQTLINKELEKLHETRVKENNRIKIVGCIWCRKIFDFSEIKDDLLYNNVAAECPKCEFTFLVPKPKNTKDFKKLLNDAHRYWYDRIGDFSLQVDLVPKLQQMEKKYKLKLVSDLNVTLMQMSATQVSLTIRELHKSDMISIKHIDSDKLIPIIYNLLNEYDIWDMNNILVFSRKSKTFTMVKVHYL